MLKKKLVSLLWKAVAEVDRTGDPMKLIVSLRDSLLQLQNDAQEKEKNNDKSEKGENL